MSILVKLDKSTSYWGNSDLSGLPSGSSGVCIWTDGINIYYSNYQSSSSNSQYILKGNKWYSYTWHGDTENVHASRIWTDGDNIYNSAGSSVGCKLNITSVQSKTTTTFPIIT